MGIARETAVFVVVAAAVVALLVGLLLHARRRGHAGRARLAATLTAIVAAFSIAFVAYTSTYYHADESALSSLESTDSVQVQALQGGGWAFIPSQPSGSGVVLYPGAKVEPASYAPLAQRIAEQGVTCVITDPPFNFAIFDIQAATRAERQLPQVESWCVGGHSLGGVAASQYASSNAVSLSGLVLLASYSATDLTKTGLPTLSIYGTEDKVLNMKQYRDSEKNLAKAPEELVITGGCHAYFGSYGTQSGDGSPTITRDAQQEETAQAIAAFALAHAGTTGQGA